MKAILDYLCQQKGLDSLADPPDAASDGLRRRKDSDQNVASMTVGMGQVVLHQHREEGPGSQTGYGLVHGVGMGLIVAYGPALDELLDKHFIGRLGEDPGERDPCLVNSCTKLL